MWVGCIDSMYFFPLEMGQTDDDDGGFSIDLCNPLKQEF